MAKGTQQKGGRLYIRSKVDIREKAAISKVQVRINGEMKSCVLQMLGSEWVGSM